MTIKMKMKRHREKGIAGKGGVASVISEVL